MILLKKALSCCCRGAFYQFLKPFCRICLLDQLLKLSIDSLLLSNTTTHAFSFPAWFSLRLILFWKQVRNVFSQGLNFLANALLRDMQHFLARFVQIVISSTWVVILIRVFRYLIQDHWLVDFNHLSLLSTSELSRFLIKTLTASMRLMTDYFLVWIWNLFAASLLNLPLRFCLKLWY